MTHILFDSRSSLQLGAFASLSTALAGAARYVTSTSNNEPTDDTPLTIGYVPIACSAPIAIANALGLFKKHGVNVTLKKYSGWSDLWTAYATEQLDVAHMLSPMTVAINAGVTNASRPTELSFTQNTNGQAITLASKHYGSVNSTADLKGMVLGIPFEYSVHALLLRDYLASNAVDPIADLELRLLRPADRGGHERSNEVRRGSGSTGCHPARPAGPGRALGSRQGGPSGTRRRGARALRAADLREPGSAPAGRHSRLTRTRRERT